MKKINQYPVIDFSSVSALTLNESLEEKINEIFKIEE